MYIYNKKHISLHGAGPGPWALGRHDELIELAMYLEALGISSADVKVLFQSRELRSAAALGRFRTRDAQRATGAKTVQGLVHQHPKGWGVQALVKDNYRQKKYPPRW